MQSLFNNKKARLESYLPLRKKVVTKPREVPDNVIKSCTSCQCSLPYDDFMQNLYVCPECGHHLRISARERIRQLCDSDSFKELDKSATSKNETNFEGYDDKLNKAKSTTGLNEAVICGVATINSRKLAIAVMDSNFMMGSMGVVVGEKITRTIEYASDKNLPLLIVTTSGGARMQEGIMSLMQMAKTSAALKRHSDKGLLYLTLLTDPTTGGVSASFAMLGDIILAEPKTLIGFAGKRVIEKTVKEQLPAEFQKSEFLLEKGFVDLIVKRKDLRKTIDKLLLFHGVK